MNQYGAVEVPNVRLVLFNHGTQIRTIDLETVCDYMEDFETDKENSSIRIYSATIDKEDIDFLESKEYNEILAYRCLIIRNADTGNDELYFPPTLTFTRLNFEYSLAAGGEPTQWQIWLGN